MVHAVNINKKIKKKALVKRGLSKINPYRSVQTSGVTLAGNTITMVHHVYIYVVVVGGTCTKNLNNFQDTGVEKNF
jgi:hypothetical protein